MCYFLRITVNKAFFPRKPLCWRAVNLSIKRPRGKTTFRKLSSTRGKIYQNLHETHQSKQHEAKTTCDCWLLQQHALLLVD